MKRTIYAAPPKVEGLDENQKAEVYRGVFDLVCDPKDWRAAIDATLVVPAWILPTDEDLRAFVETVKDAVEFMTATEALMVPMRGTDFASNRPVFVFSVKAVGYRSGPAGC